VESDGKVAIFNSSALIYALANALRTLGARENNQALIEYSKQLKKALIETVEQGTITGDLKGKTINQATENVVDMQQFLDAIEHNLNLMNH
jgi:isocitrate dehydrogenase